MNWAAIGLVLAIAGCSTVKVDGDCTLVRLAEVRYQCKEGSKVEHTRILAPDPAP